MKKNILFATIGVFCIFLAGCGNDGHNYVEKEAYDSIVSEVEELKSKVDEINEKEFENMNNNEEQSISNNSKEDYNKDEMMLLRDFLFEYDENNTISISLYQDGKRKMYIYGTATYEEENMGLLLYDWKEKGHGIRLFVDFLIEEIHCIEITLTIGEDEYRLNYIDGELITDTIPIEEKVDFPDKYRDKCNKSLDEFMRFIHNE